MTTSGIHKEPAAGVRGYPQGNPQGNPQAEPPKLRVPRPAAEPSPDTSHEALHGWAEREIAALQASLGAVSAELAEEHQLNVKRDDLLATWMQRVKAVEERPADAAGGDSLRLRFTSRKFLLSAATAVGAVLAALAGALPAEWAAVIAAASAGVFTLAEGFADAQARGVPAAVRNTVSIKQD
jgi:hypothetical protein